jgi:hypothetical protein
MLHRLARRESHHGHYAHGYNDADHERRIRERAEVLVDFCQREPRPYSDGQIYAVTTLNWAAARVSRLCPPGRPSACDVRWLKGSHVQNLHPHSVQDDLDGCHESLLQNPAA